MATPKKSVTVSHSPSVVSKKVNDSWIVLEPNKRYVRTLNESAGFIWSLTASPITTDGIARRLAKKYGIPLEDALADTEAFIRSYVKAGLLTQL